MLLERVVLLRAVVGRGQTGAITGWPKSGRAKEIGRATVLVIRPFGCTPLGGGGGGSSGGGGRGGRGRCDETEL